MYDSKPIRDGVLAADARYEVRLASTPGEVESALRLRYEVFGRELGGGGGAASGSGIETDAHDRTCEHLIVVDRATGETVGTYRMKSFEAAGGAAGFYSHAEFALEALPADVLADAIETGRACVAAGHRGTKAIFLLWKALARHLTRSGKRYFFGCCSLFTDDPADGDAAYNQIESGGYLHEQFRVEPRIAIEERAPADAPRIKLPGLFEMYLRMGARVCGRPTYDADFRSVDFFIVFDLQAMEPKYRQMFLG